jgi:hypothetical protein
MSARKRAELAKSGGQNRKRHGGRSPIIVKSRHRGEIEAMLVVSNQYAMMSRYIEHKFGEKYSRWTLKRYRENNLKDRVAEYEKKRAELEKSTDAKDEKIRKVAALGEKLLCEAHDRKGDILKQMGEHLQGAVTAMDKAKSEVGKQEKALEKKISALTENLETGFEQYRERMKESTMSPLEVYLFLKNCGLLVIENKMSLMMKMPMAMGSVMSDLKIVSELNDKVRDEMISLGQHPPMQPSGPFGGGNVFVGNNQVVGRMNVGRDQQEPEMTREVARAGLFYLAELAKARMRREGVEIRETDD